MTDETQPPKPSITSGLGESLKDGFLNEMQTAVFGFLSGTRSFYALFAISLLLIIITSLAGLDALRIGYHHAYNVSREIPWGILISTYVFFVVTSTGLCIVSSIGHVFGVKAFMPIVNRAVFLSVVTIFAGFTVIFFDIENPFRMAIYNVISPNFSSNMWWMGTLYGAYMVFMGVEFVFLMLENHKFATYAGLAGLLSGIAAHSNLGALFGMLHAREFWYGPYMPIYFIASAAMSGGAAVLFFTIIGYRVNDELMEAPMKRALESVGKLTALMIAVLMFFTTWKIITGFVGGEEKKAVIIAMISGPYAFNFWVFEILLGMVLPFAMLLSTKFRNLSISFYASVFMIIGIFFMRYDLVILGQVVPSFHGLGVRDLGGLLPYIPSTHEVIITIGGMGIVAAGFLMGERIFKGHKSSH